MVDGRLASKAVLLIEECQGGRDSLESVLRAAGCTVFTAEDGAGALAMLQTGTKVDVILMAVPPSRWDGWDFLQRRAQSPELTAIPIVFVSAVEAGGELHGTTFRMRSSAQGKSIIRCWRAGTGECDPGAT